jgi:hypothetical protein
MDKETWLDDIENLSFRSELQKLSESPIYPEEKNIDEEELEPEIEDEGDGYVYHSNDGIMMRNNQTTKNKIDKLKKKAKKKI